MVLSFLSDPHRRTQGWVRGVLPPPFLWLPLVLRTPSPTMYPHERHELIFYNYWILKFLGLNLNLTHRVSALNSVSTHQIVVRIFNNLLYIHRYVQFKMRQIWSILLLLISKYFCRWPITRKPLQAPKKLRKRIFSPRARAIYG